MPSFVRLDFFDKLACQSSPTRIGVLYPQDLASAGDVQSIDDPETLHFAFSRVDRLGQVRTLTTTLLGRMVARVVWSDASFDEWRVAQVEDGRHTNGLVTVTCNPLILDLSDGADSSTAKGLVSIVSGNFRLFSFTAASETATQLWDNYIIPACPSWVTRGTIDPTLVIDTLAWDRLTPGALAMQVRDTLRRKGVTCELRLRRNGTTDYKLDLVTQLGASAAVPLFHPRTALATLKRQYDTTQQATRVFAKSSINDPSGYPGSLGRARWAVTAVDGANKKLTLADSNGGAGPIGFTDQWKNAYIVRAQTGKACQISAANASTQQVTLSVTTMPGFAAGETVEIRLTEPKTNTRVAANPSVRYAITTVDGANKKLTLASNPITVDSQFVDWYARVWSASVGGTVIVDCPVTASVAATDIVTTDVSVASVTTSHYVEFVQLDGVGEIAAYAEDPARVQAYPTGYGMKAADRAVDDVVGVAQLVPNGWMRTWANPANPPDGWQVFVQGASSTSQNTNALYTVYGGKSLAFDTQYTGAADYLYVFGPRLDPIWTPYDTLISVRARVFFTTFSGTGAFILKVQPIDATGVPGLTSMGAGFSASTTVVPVGAGGGTQVGTGSWITIEILGVPVSAYGAPYGIGAFIQFQPVAAAHAVGYIDTFEVYPFTGNPSAVYEFGDAQALHQAANAYLATNSTPLVAYTVQIADLERLDPTAWSRNAITLGGNVRVVDPDFGVDATVRLLRLERDLLRPAQSVLGLSNRRALLTQLVQTT